MNPDLLVEYVLQYMKLNVYPVPRTKCMIKSDSINSEDGKDLIRYKKRLRAASAVVQNVAILHQ